MGREILGIHHVTAIAGNPQQNLDFYAGILGLRLVKLTVNYDDPGTYHLYYGDEQGHPGSILTFFPWPRAPKGLLGTGQVSVISFSIPQDAINYWIERLRQNGINVKGPGKRFDEKVLLFYDRDGIELELVAHSEADVRSPWRSGPVPPEYSIRGIHSVTLWEEGYERTASLLTDTLGFRLIQEDRNRFRFESGHGGPGTFVDILCLPDVSRGQVAVGTVHHVAWRTPNDEEQKAWRQEIANLGFNISPVMDRRYFHSIYFREPGGVLFEIATDPQGFSLDEPPEQLGSHLMLPPWLEPMRQELEKTLPSILLPKQGSR